jgi:hypothetical protein
MVDRLRRIPESQGRMPVKMRGLAFTWLLLLLILPAVSACQVAAQGGKPELMAEKERPTTSTPNAFTEILVRFEAHVPSEEIARINKSLGVAVVRVIPFPRIYVVRVPEQMSATELAAKYTTFPQVKYAEPNYALNLR